MGAYRKTYSFEIVEIWLFDIPIIHKIFPIKSRKTIKSSISLQFEIWFLAHARVVMDAPSMNQPRYRDHSFFLTQGQCYGLFPTIQYQRYGLY